MTRQMVLIRHGESSWNKENRFTGWKDVDLSETGLLEAEEAGKTLKRLGFKFDQAYSSVLKRAMRTLWIVQDQMDCLWLPVTRSWRLNERHYGDLQGLDKAETAAKHGEEQVKIWRRSYDTPPPLLDYDDPRHPRFDERYKNEDPRILPCGESLKDTVARFLPFWESDLYPALKKNKKILIVAHGNSIRALIQHLEGLSAAEIMEVNIPTGIPLLYELDENGKVLNKKYLGEDDRVKAAIDKVAGQGKAKK